MQEGLEPQRSAKGRRGISFISVVKWVPFYSSPGWAWPFGMTDPDPGPLGWGFRL